MAKEKSELSKEERKALKKSKQITTESNSAGVTKVKSEKKDKKEKKAKREALAEKALNEIQNPTTTPSKKKKEKEDAEMKSDSEDEQTAVEGEKTASRPVGALVPFANPLADEKVGKKVFKSVKKAAGQRTLKRGVKEVVKALRKSPTDNSTSSAGPIGVVVLAADISPMDVISHIPVLCEDHNIPYIYVSSRAELGMAGQTKRPTSVVLVSREVGKKGKDAKSTDDGDWDEVYKGLVKAVQREGGRVKV